MAGEAVTEGIYNHSTWQIFSKGSLESQESQVASIHESMHHVLNNTSLFGLILVITAYLARNEPEYKSKLLTFVANSRLTHEIYATYSSLLIVSPEIASLDWVKERYHSSYTKYITYAKDITLGVGAPHLQYACLYAVCRLCFQSEGLVKEIRNGTPLNIDFNDFPDYRLRYLIECLDEKFWITTINSYQENFDTHITRQFLKKGGNDWVETNYGVESLNEISTEFQSYVYTVIKQRFMLGKFDSIDNNDHLDHLQLLLDFAESIVPGNLSLGPLKKDSQPEQDFGLSEFENEAIVIRQQQLKAKVVQLTDIDDINAIEYNFEGLKHIYIASRTTENLIKQFDFDKKECQWLLENHPDFVVAIFSKKLIAGEPVMVIVIIDTPSEIKDISNQKHFILSNSSMILVMDNRWGKWHEVLQKYSTHTILFDLPPSTHIDRNSKLFNIIEYQKFSFELNETSCPLICLVGRGECQTGVYFLPGSEVMTKILSNYLSSRDYTRLYPEEENCNQGINLVIKYGMTHLYNEYTFDFQALNTSYAQRGFMEGHFESQ